MSIRHLLNLTGDRLHTLPIAILYLTDGCNSRCAMCDIWRNPRRNMAWHIVEQIAENARASGLRWAVLSGGEAMQHPEWAKIAARLRAEGVRVFLLTNGLLVKRQIDDVIAHVDELIISLDAGTAATYEAIRGVDGFDLVLEGIRLASAGGVRVTTRTTVQAANFRELSRLIDAAKRAGAASISFLTIDVSNPVAFGERGINLMDYAADPSLMFDTSVREATHVTPVGALSSENIVELNALLDEMEIDHADDYASGLIAESPAKLRRMIGYFNGVIGDAVFPPVACNAPHLSAVIEVDGSLRPCYFLPKMGRLQGKGRFMDAFNAPEAVALRRAYRNGERAECGRCVCPLHKNARSLLGM